MLSAAIVIFREVFEIVLIVGIILAATREVPRRWKAVGIGFGAGLSGAGLVAFFTGEISRLAEGVGQEIFSALILFTAAGFIGWTVLWMKKHAREMKAHFTQVGQDVATGKLPYFSLSLIIALAILREGSEIVLFSYGMLASGMSVLTLAGGCLLGLLGGLAAGIALYKGLITFPMKHFFRVTSWILVMLVAGMMSQGAAFLSAAGAFGNLSHTVWNTSWLLSDGSILGQSLKTLIGYTARPTEIQLIAYAGTLVTMLCLLNLSGRKHKALKAGGAVAVMLALGLWALPAHAVDKLDTPYVVKGEAELEWNASTAFDHRRDRDGAQAHELEFEYGLTDRWLMELSGGFEAANRDDSLNGTEFEWANRFQLTEAGEYWLDPGLQLAYVHGRLHDAADALEAKILLEKDVGRVANLSNITFEKEIGGNAGHGTAAAFSWNTRYRHNPHFEPGIEWQSDFGVIRNGSSFNQQEHAVGPAVYGSIVGHVNYQVAYLIGVSREAPDGVLRGNLEYEWHF
jgi:high-affinity iron transporter